LCHRAALCGFLAARFIASRSRARSKATTRSLNQRLTRVSRRSAVQSCVSPLLRELLTRAASLPALYEERGANAHLIALLLEELAAARVDDLHLPMPNDARLRRIVDLMMASPADRSTLEVWAKRAGLSERTLARWISRETGMSFVRFRQQLCVMLAVKWLAGGASIQQVSADLGYESVPSFVTMFRKALGTSPGRYMAQRYAGRRTGKTQEVSR